jgi:nucleoside-diphosphate-sugar epimerase
MTAVVTGAGGYLGGRIARALRDHGGYGDVIALGRGEADLTVPGALDAVPADGVTHIVHTAAVTAFGVGQATATAVNVRGTERVIEFARRCPDLERLVFLSTLYTAGTATGDIAEEPAPAAGESGRPGRGTVDGHFANYYEWSKQAAEQLVLGSGLPATIARVSTVVADDDNGHVTQFNAVHNTLKLLYYGLLSVMPGDRATPVAVATAEFSVDATMALLAAEPGIYHLCPDAAQTPTLGQLVDLMYTVFEREPGFIRRGILRPLIVDEGAFNELLAGIRSLHTGPVQDAVESVAPFSVQLYRPKFFENTRLRKAWPGYRAPDPAVLVSETASYLVRTRWGRSA